MTENEIIKDLECRIDNFSKSVLNLINSKNAENERLEKDCEELIYKIEYILCHATGNKFSKYTYAIQDMLSFVDDYIQDCCDEAVEDAKVNIKSEAIKEFADRLRNCFCVSKEYLDIVNIIDNLVKEMTEVETNQRKEDEEK